MSTGDIAEQLTAIRSAIEDAAQQRDLSVNDVRLVAVTKTVDCSAVRAALAAGQKAFGENRVQELEHKARELPPEIEWHFIGHLQRNKVRATLRVADWIHSVDSNRLLKHIERIAKDENRIPKVLLQVNVSGEASKFGVSPAEVPALAQEAAECKNIEFLGFMTMAPYGSSPQSLHRIFRDLRNLRDQMSEKTGLRLPELSMGMSGDFHVAVSEGATMVRIGSAIFGQH